MKKTLRVFICFLSYVLFSSISYFAQTPKTSNQNFSSNLKSHIESELSLNDIYEMEPNNSPSVAQIILSSQYPIVINGNAEVDDVGTLTLHYDDDIEDLFQIAVSSNALTILLDGFNLDCDLYLLDDLGDEIYKSDSSGAAQAEEIYIDYLPVGTYLIGVSIYENASSSGNSTPYVLTIYDESLLIESNVTISLSLDFGDHTKSTSYRMIGLPGNINLPLSEVLSGTGGEDWIAYYDNGNDNEDDYMVKYDGSNTFNFNPGNGFWILAKNSFSFIREVDNVPLNFDGTYSIVLHSGWNIISNPINVNVNWTDVQAENLIDENIYEFNGTYEISYVLEPYKGYYFYNFYDDPSLEIPYIILGNYNSTLPKTLTTNSNKIVISLAYDNLTKSKIEIGIHEDAKESYDKYDKFTPPGNFEEFKLSIFEKELESSYKYLLADYIPSINKGRIFNVDIKTIPNESFTLISKGVQNFNEYEVFLVDDRLSKLYDLKVNEILSLNLTNEINNFKLLIGTEEFINEFKTLIIPPQFNLFQNYPNPFNPSTTIKYTIPSEGKSEKGKVNLIIYDILGSEVSVLVNEIQDAGYYEIYFDASSLSSGMYFYRLISGEFTETKKMLLLR